MGIEYLKITLSLDKYYCWRILLFKGYNLLCPDSSAEIGTKWRTPIPDRASSSLPYLGSPTPTHNLQNHRFNFLECFSMQMRYPYYFKPQPMKLRPKKNPFPLAKVNIALFTPIKSTSRFIEYSLRELFHWRLPKKSCNSEIVKEPSPSKWESERTHAHTPWIPQGKHGKLNHMLWQGVGFVPFHEMKNWMQLQEGTGEKVWKQHLWWLSWALETGDLGCQKKIPFRVHFDFKVLWACILQGPRTKPFNTLRATHLDLYTEINWKLKSNSSVTMAILQASAGTWNYYLGQGNTERAFLWLPVCWQAQLLSKLKMKEIFQAWFPHATMIKTS